MQRRPMKQISVRLPAPVVARLEDEARRREVALAQVVRRALEEWAEARPDHDDRVTG